VAYGVFCQAIGSKRSLDNEAISGIAPPDKYTHAALLMRLLAGVRWLLATSYEIASYLHHTILACVKSV
jgi:hypothetical protein